MKIIAAFFSNILNLDNFLLVPIILTIVGLIVGAGLKRSLQGGIIVGIGLIGMNTVLSLLWNYIGPVTQIFVEKSGLALDSVDIGWSAAAGVAFSTPVGSLIIPFILLLNIILLALNITQTINIDIWNYWHYAFSGAVVYSLTNNYLMAFTAAGCHCALALVLADQTALTMQRAIGAQGISIPQGFAVTEIPIFLTLDKFYDLLHLPKGKGFEEKENGKQSEIIQFLTQPMILGLIIGVALGIFADYDFKMCLTVGMSMAALMYLLPRMVQIIMQGLMPISSQAKVFMEKKLHRKDFYIGCDSAIMLGVPQTMQVALILIPVTLLLAMVLPYNTTLPVGDLASTAYFVSMATPIHNNGFIRTLISSIVMMAIVLGVASFFAPLITKFTATGAVTIPEGAGKVTALSAGNWFAGMFYKLAEIGILGAIIMVVITIVAIMLIKRNSKLDMK